MTGIFISYRREDSGPYAGRLYDALTTHFGRDSVFFDVDVIGPGEDFREVIQRTCSSCKILLAVIGRQWATVCDKNGKLRLESKNDTLRIEIALALQNGLRVIPVLVGGAEMPDESALPEDLQALAYRNALDVSDKRFHQDVQTLVEALKKTLDNIPQQASVGVAKKKRISSPSEKSKTMPEEETKAAPLRRRATSPASNKSNSAPSQAPPSLLPLYGIVPGETTQRELAKIGRRTKSIDDATGKPYHSYDVQGADFWCDDAGNVVDHLYVSHHDPMPEPWRRLGFRWENSYDQWLSVLKKLGYPIEIEDEPHIEQWEDHDSFTARVTGQKLGVHPHEIDLTFSFSQGTAASSSGTLYQITITRHDSDGNDDEEEVGDEILDDNEEIEDEIGLAEDEDSPSSSNEEASLYPLYGIILGETTVRELAKMGQRADGIFSQTGKPYFYYTVKETQFWYDETSKFVDSISAGTLYPVPEPWEKLGISVGAHLVRPVALFNERVGIFDRNRNRTPYRS